jgi:gamma-butyrobetaine dioxygenase
VGRDGDGTTSVTIGGAVFPAGWLRDACGCPRCRDLATGQRLHGPAQVDPETRVTRHQVRDGQVEVVFVPDGHSATFDLGWLADHAPGRWRPAGDRSDRYRSLWRAADLPSGPTRVTWERFGSEPDGIRAALTAVVESGVALVTGVPTVPGTVLAVAETFGHVRTTNYGRYFDVTVEPAPDHLASTPGALAPHTDNPYRDPVPTVQVLHCLRSAGDGGETLLVDGFAAARRLRQRDPAAFATLARVPLPFRYDSAVASLAAYAPTISLDQGGAVTQIRWNDRCVQPPAVSTDQITEVYRAIRAFAAVLGEDGTAVRLGMRPGDCLILDNTRILHGRTGFSAASGAPRRHLQGCYADLDGLHSTLTRVNRASAVSREGGT